MSELENIHDASAFLALARSELPRLLEEWSGLQAAELSSGPLPEADGVEHEVDLVLEWAGHRLLVEVKSGGRAAQVSGGIDRLREHVGPNGSDVGHLLVVPFMGSIGEQLCAEAGVNWVDLSGNAEIRLGSIIIHRRGGPNRFRIRDAKVNPFAGKSSRVGRLLLRDPLRWWKQEELIAASRLSRGYVSRVAAGLEAQNLVVRDEARKLRPRDPGLLLDAWREVYVPREGLLISGHVAARSGEALADVIAPLLSVAGVKYALTALAAAWEHAPMSHFRNVHAYVKQKPDDHDLGQMGFRATSQGANLHLIVTGEQMVWEDSVSLNEKMCVSPLQAYLDLKDAGERSVEAGEHLRHKCLTWRQL